MIVLIGVQSVLQSAQLPWGLIKISLSKTSWEKDPRKKKSALKRTRQQSQLHWWTNAQKIASAKNNKQHITNDSNAKEQR